MSLSPHLRVLLFSLPLLFLFVCLFVSPVPVRSAVLGIDFGSEYIKVASVKPGTPFHIVVDEQSKRKIPAVVAFDSGERQFGNSATQFTMRKPKETYWFVMRLLGRAINSPEAEDFRAQGFPYELVEIPERSSIGFRHVQGDQNVTVYSAEELIAMSLQHVIKCAEADAGGVPVKDAVLTTPLYWSQIERQALIDAAELAGLNVLALINENSAAAIQFGIDRKFDNTTDRQYYLLYNMGSTATEVSLVALSSYQAKQGKHKNKWIGQVEVVATAADATLGGQYFETVITEYLVSDIEAQVKAKKADAAVRSNPRVMAKIRSAAEKAKTVLSANIETPIYLPSLTNDMDFKVHLTREKFYELAKPLIDRVNAPIQQALEQAGVTVEQLNATLIIGGGVRIPAIQSAMKSFLKRDHLGQSLNGDEAMAMGAVFRAANLSTSFQVRPLGFVDISPFAVGVNVADLAEGQEEPFAKKTSLFKRNNALNRRKTVAFSHSRDLRVSLFHEQPELLAPGTPAQIIDYEITGLNDAEKNEKFSELLKNQKPRVSLSFFLDANGIVSLLRADATLEQQVKVYLPKPKQNNTETVNATATANATEAEKNETAKADENAEKSAENEAEKNENEEKESEASDEAKEPAAESSEAASSTNSTSDPSVLIDEKGEYRLKNQTIRIPVKLTRVPVKGTPAPFTTADRREARIRLERLRRADELKKEIAAAKNDVEAHVYLIRNQMNEGQFDEISTEEQRSSVAAALEAAEEWLYDQSDESVDPFQAKLSELKALTDPLQSRKAELTDRPAALKAARDIFNYTRHQIAEFEKNRPWVKEEDRDRVSKMVNETEAWIAEKSAAQDAKAPHEEPEFTSKQVTDKLRPIVKLMTELEKLKKPVEKPKPKKEKKETKDKANKDSSSSDEKKDKNEENAEKEKKDEENEKDEKKEESNNGESESESESEQTEAKEEKKESKDEL